MTSQTIDGVQGLRDLLERISAEPSDVDAQVRRQDAVDELRALLDAPIPFPGYPPVPEDRKLPAAQPQGEPFGYWLFPKGLPLHGMFHRVTQSDKVIDSQSVVEAFEITPLYAEQPAPVAVVLPEREMYCQYLRVVIPDNRLEVEAHKDGWNACLDELKRLNPSL